MAIYAVTYDLRKPGRDYKPVHEYLEHFTHCKDMESFWLVDSALSASQIRDALQGLVDKNDKVFVIRLQREWASVGFNCATWLKATERRW